MYSFNILPREESMTETLILSYGRANVQAGIFYWIK